MHDSVQLQEGTSYGCCESKRMVDPGFIFEPNLGPKYRVFNLHMYSILSKLSSDGASKGVNICLSVRIITVLDTFVNIISSKDRRRLASAQKYVGTCPSADWSRLWNGNRKANLALLNLVQNTELWELPRTQTVHVQVNRGSSLFIGLCDVGRSICGVYLLGQTIWQTTRELDGARWTLNHCEVHQDRDCLPEMK